MATTPEAVGGRRAAGAHLAVARELAGMAKWALTRPAAGSRSNTPSLLRLRACEEAPSHRTPYPTPVVLVPGYGGNRSNWWALEQALRGAGFSNLQATAYDPTTTELPEIAARLVEQCGSLIDDSAADHVHLIGHSLGGVIVRYAVSRLGLLRTGCAVTIAAPHLGTAVARLGRGPAAAAVRPGSPLLAALTDPPPNSVRWIAYYSNLDVVVPPRSARLDEPALRADNIRVPDHGHLSILRSPVLVRSIAARLVAAESALPPGDLGADLLLAG